MKMSEEEKEQLKQMFNEHLSVKEIAQHFNCSDSRIYYCLKQMELKAKNNQFIAKDITDKRHGRLVAKRPLKKNKHGQWVWLCECDCGETTELTTSAFKQTNSCGCLLSESNTVNGKETMKKIHKKYYVNNTNIALIGSMKLSKRNKSGTKGVYWADYAQKWRVEIRCQGKRIHVGYFSDLADAIEARELAEKELYDPILTDFNKRE